MTSQEALRVASQAIGDAVIPHFREHPREVLHALLIEASGLVLARHFPELGPGEVRGEMEAMVEILLTAMAERVEELRVQMN